MLSRYTGHISYRLCLVLRSHVDQRSREACGQKPLPAHAVSAPGAPEPPGFGFGGSGSGSGLGSGSGQVRVDIGRGGFGLGLGGYWEISREGGSGLG